MNQGMDEYVAENMKIVARKLSHTISVTNTEFARQLKAMYKYFIQDFYKYKTTSYIRNNTNRPGSQRGWTLYQGAKIFADNHKGGRRAKLIWDFYYDGAEWAREGLKEPHYQFADADRVLHQVVDAGIRFPGERGAKEMLWDPVGYVGDYWSIPAGTIAAAFDYIDVHFDEIAAKIFSPLWQKAIDHGLIQGDV